MLLLLPFFCTLRVNRIAKIHIYRFSPWFLCWECWAHFFFRLHFSVVLLTFLFVVLSLIWRSLFMILSVKGNHIIMHEFKWHMCIVDRKNIGSNHRLHAIPYSEISGRTWFSNIKLNKKSFRLLNCNGFF